MKTIFTLATVLAAFSLSACKKSESIDTASAEIIAPDPALKKFFTEEEIPKGESISIVRSTLKPGDEISLSGLVMGRDKVFVDGRALFILGDPKTLTPCSEMGEDDHCPTPWDLCCEEKSVLRNGIASIQILGENGRVLAGNIKGTNGLKELSAVTVIGKVAEQSTPDALLINATKIYVSTP